MDKEIMELAAELGRAIKNDARLVRMDKAREAFENDSALQELFEEYNAQRAALGEEYKKDEQDSALTDAITDRIDELYESITKNEIYIEYLESQEEVNRFMNEVNGEITFNITGERPCTHDCSCCHSDCGHAH